MNGMDTYVSQNVSPHEGTLGSAGDVMTPVTSSAQAAYAATAHTAPSPTVYNTRLLVNGSHPKKIENWPPYTPRHTWVYDSNDPPKYFFRWISHIPIYFIVYLNKGALLFVLLSSPTTTTKTITHVRVW